MAKCKCSKCGSTRIVSNIVQNMPNGCFDVCTNPICGSPDELSILAPLIYDEIGINLCTTFAVGTDISTTYPTATNASVSVIDIAYTYGDENVEITIEVNPGTVTLDKLEDYNKAGINRLSIGLQSTHEHLLKEIGRIHTYLDFLDTFRFAREAGFENINVDLMIGLPNQTLAEVQDSIEEIVSMEPEHISVYSLILEEGTPLFKKVEEGLELPDEELERKMYWTVKQILETNGYNHYEISNFAKQGYESKHNLDCWNQKEYIGFGIAAHSYTNGIRYSNIENLEQYIKNYEEDKTEENLVFHEKQDMEAMQKEYMLLGLRKIDGVSIQKFKIKFVANPVFLYHDKLEKLVNEELVEIDGDQIKLTNKGLDLANIVWEEFI